MSAAVTTERSSLDTARPTADSARATTTPMRRPRTSSLPLADEGRTGVEGIEPDRAVRAQAEHREPVARGQVEVLALGVQDGQPLAGHGLAVQVGLDEGGLAVALVARDQHARREQGLGVVEAERVVTEHALAEHLLADDRAHQGQPGLALERVGGGRVAGRDRHGCEAQHQSSPRAKRSRHSGNVAAQAS